MKIHAVRLATLAFFCVPYLTAQPVDDTQLKQVIIFGRHSVRSPVAPYSFLNAFSANPFPDFGVSAPGILTDQGKALETILGGYYRLRLINEGLLTGHDGADSAFVYFHANTLERTIETAKALWTGMLPAAGAPIVDVVAQGSDPLFDPVGAGVALLDPQKAVAAVLGRLGGNPESETRGAGADGGDTGATICADCSGVPSVMVTLKVSCTVLPGTTAPLRSATCRCWTSDPAEVDSTIIVPGSMVTLAAAAGAALGAPDSLGLDGAAFGGDDGGAAGGVDGFPATP